MAARIRSLRNGITPFDEASRNDLVIGDVVVVSSLDAATTYAWTLTYVPEGSAATFSGSSTAVSPGSFTVDRVGAYMVRLVVDAGLPTERTQYVRLRALTTPLGLTLVGAGERRDGTGIIPVDIDPTGWADEVNNNLLALEAAIAAAAGTLGTLAFSQMFPPTPGSSSTYQGWAPVTSRLIGVRVKMETLNNQGTYTLTVVNNATGNSVISAPFNMNALVAGVVTSVPLTGVSADLDFATLDEWTITLTSNNVAFNGSGIYVELVFNTATAGGPVIEDLATTLLVGNSTSGTDIIVTNGDVISGQAAASGSGLDGFDLVLRGGAGDGGGSQGFVVLDGKVRGASVFLLEQDAGTAWTPGANQGAFYVSNGSSGRQDNTPYFVDDTATHIPLLGGVVDSAAQAAPISINLPRGIRLFSPSITAGAAVEGVLPAATTMRGVVVTVEHRGNGTGTLTLNPAGADTVGGQATFVVPFGSIYHLQCDGINDWRILSVNTASTQDWQQQVSILPNGTVDLLWFAPANLTILEVLVYTETTPTTAGTYLLTVQDMTHANNLLAAANYDLETNPPTTLTSLGLTGTLANRELTKGTRVRFRAVSNNVDLVASGLYVQIIYRVK